MPEEIAQSTDGFIVGRVKWFNNQKAFGFIELPGGGLDVFVHANQLRRSGIDRVLLQGETVRFVTSKGPKGSFAVNISIVENVTPKSPNGG